MAFFQFYFWLLSESGQRILKKFSCISVHWIFLHFTSILSVCTHYDNSLSLFLQIIFCVDEGHKQENIVLMIQFLYILQVLLQFFFFFFTSLAFFLSPCILDVVPETPTLLFLQHKQICCARILKWWWVGCIHLKQKERKKRKEFKWTFLTVFSLKKKICIHLFLATWWQQIWVVDTLTYVIITLLSCYG